MTNVIKGIGWNEPAIATEQGWMSKSGELLVSSRNLLTNRVLQGFASDEEVARWVDIKSTEIIERRKKVVAAKEENQKRLGSIKERFEKDTADIAKKGETDLEAQIQFLQKQVELKKTEAEYAKSFAACDDELLKLDEKEEKVKSFIKEAKKPEAKKVSPPKPVEPVVAEPVAEKVEEVVVEKPVADPVVEPVAEPVAKEEKKAKSNKKEKKAGK